MNIKNIISFDEFNAVVTKVTNDCFVDNIYSPVYFDISLRTALISAFAPDFELNDEDDEGNNTLYASVYTDDACTVVDTIKNKPQYCAIISAIENGIKYRINVLTSGGMSMSDIAISRLIDKVTEIANKVDGYIDAESLKKVVDSISSSNGSLTEEGMVKAIFDAGLLNKVDTSEEENGKH